jgi:hypothetical protein
VPLATFDTSLQQWSFLFSSNPPAASTAAFDGAVGQPDPGSAMLTIPFVPNPSSATTNEQVDFGINFAAPMDLSGKTLTARVKLDAGLGASGGGAKLIIKSGAAFVYADGGFQNLTPGDWITLTTSFDTPGFAGAGYTPTQIVQVDVEIQANGATAFTTATVHIDTVGYQ